MRNTFKHINLLIHIVLLNVGLSLLSGCALPIGAVVMTLPSPLWHYQMYTGGYELETFPTLRYHGTYGTANQWCGETIAVPFYIPLMLPYGMTLGAAFDIAFFPIDLLAYAIWGTTETPCSLIEQEHAYLLQIPSTRLQTYHCASYAKHATLFSLKIEEGSLTLPCYSFKEKGFEQLTLSPEHITAPQMLPFTYPKGSTLLFVVSAPRGNPILPGFMEIAKYKENSTHTLTFHSFGIIPPEAMPADGSFPHEWMQKTYIDSGYNGSLNKERSYLTGLMSDALEPSITTKRFYIPSQTNEEGLSSLQIKKSDDFKGEIRCFGLTRDIRRQANL